jgi:hypothetical protein
MADFKAGQSEKQDQGTGFSLDRERARITIMKYLLAVLFSVLINSLFTGIIQRRGASCRAFLMHRRGCNIPSFKDVYA